jgi:deoxyribonuclease V
MLEAALRALPARPDVLVVNATGRDHPRRSGLAVQLGSLLGVPSVGVTNRPLLATGPLPDDRRGATSALRIGDELVAHWVRTRGGTRPLVAHPGWRTDTRQAVELLLASTGRWRTPLPLRVARQAARSARADEHG